MASYQLCIFIIIIMTAWVRQICSLISYDISCDDYRSSKHARKHRQGEIDVYCITFTIITNLAHNLQ